jgi:hypothetical protein
MLGNSLTGFSTMLLGVIDNTEVTPPTLREIIKAPKVSPLPLPIWIIQAVEYFGHSFRVLGL